MADIDFSALVEQGANAWNQWRAANPDVRPDLSRAYLYGQVLRGFDLSHVNFERACLIGANLAGANVSGANLASVYASSSNFSQANLTGADLRQGSFTEADFSGADLSAANVQATEFAGVNFTGACLAALRANQKTSFGGAQGQHLYIKLPPAGRFPQTGEFQPGELAAFLQQRFAPVTVSQSVDIDTANENVPGFIAALGRSHQGGANQSEATRQSGAKLEGEVLANRLVGQMRVWLSHLVQRSLVVSAATIEIGSLFLDWLLKVLSRLRRQLAMRSHQLYIWLRMELMPTVHHYGVTSRRLVRYLSLLCRRKLGRLGRQLWQQGGWTFRVFRWQSMQRWRRFCRWLLRTYQQTQRYLQQDFWPACVRFLMGALRFSRYWRIRSARSVARSQRQLLQQRQARLLGTREWWTGFVQGDHSFQRQLTTGHQALQHEFEQASEWLQVLAFRQTERFYAAGLVGERYVKLAVAMAGEQLQQSQYLQSVTSDLRKEYRRYPLPLAVGFAGAIALMLLNPALRSERKEAAVGLPPIDASTVKSGAESLNGASAAETASAAESGIENGLRDPESVEASMAESTDITLSSVRSPESPPARLNQVVTTGIDSIDLPCPASSEDLSKTLPAYPYQDGSTFYGDVVDGQPADGKGTMTYPTGNRYDGEYRNGRREGCGTFSFSDGRRYVGQFKADQFNGLGTWILENGERYIGEFDNNKCDGQGSFIYANGTVRAGMWREGVLVDSSISCEWGSLRVPASSDN